MKLLIEGKKTKMVPKPPTTGQGIKFKNPYKLTSDDMFEKRWINQENCDAIRLGRTEKSAIAEHVHTTLQEVDRESLRIVDRASWKRERKIEEALHIGKRKPSMNRKTGLRGVRYGTR